MKFLPLNNPNISSTKRQTNGVSMALGGSGFPHITWFESENGHNEVHYSFWNGTQWTYYVQSLVGWSKEELVGSGNSIVLDGSNKPNIVFGKKFTEAKSILSVATEGSGVWVIGEMEVDYEVVWIGTFYIGQLLVACLDSDHFLHIYSVVGSTWTLLSSKDMTVSTSYPSPSTFYMVSCGQYLGVAWKINGQYICNNFFDTVGLTWLFGTSFFTVSNLVDMDIVGYSTGGVGSIVCSVIDNVTGTMQIKNIAVDTNGDTWYVNGGSIVDAPEDIVVTGNNDFVSSGYSKTSISYDNVADEFNIL